MTWREKCNKCTFQVTALASIVERFSIRYRLTWPWNQHRSAIMIRNAEAVMPRRSFLLFLLFPRPLENASALLIAENVIIYMYARVGGISCALQRRCWFHFYVTLVRKRDNWAEEIRIDDKIFTRLNGNGTICCWRVYKSSRCHDSKGRICCFGTQFTTNKGRSSTRKFKKIIKFW